MSNNNNPRYIEIDENIGEAEIEKLRDIIKRESLLVSARSRIEIEFGYGKALITPIMREDKTKGAIVLQPNRGAGTVGEETSTEYFSETSNDILLTFANIESIDVLIRRLEQLKRMMNGQEENLKESNFEF